MDLIGFSMGQTSNNSRIAKNTLFLSIRMVIVLLISLYTSRVVLQVLGVNDFGIYNVVCGFASMFSFFNGSLSNGIQRFFNYELGKNGERGGRQVYNSALRIQLFFAGIIILLTETVGLWYLYHKMVIPVERLTIAFWIFQFSILGLVLGVLQAPYTAAILAHEKMSYYAFISIVDVVFRLLIVFLLSYFSCDKLLLYGILILSVNFLQFLMCFGYSKYSFKELRFSFSVDRIQIKSMLSFSGWNMFGTFAIMMKEQGVNMILNLFFGPVVNAARGVAQQVISHVRGFVNNINVAAKPQITQSYAENNVHRTMSLMFSLSKACFFTLFVLSLPLCLEIDFVLRIWLGQNVPQFTNIFIILVMLTAVVNNLNAPVSYVVHATGNMRKYQLVTSIIELLILPISYFVLKVGGAPYSVFIVTLVVVIINQYASLRILKSLVDFSMRDYIVKVIVPIFSVFFVSIWLPLVLRLVMTDGVLRFLVVGFVSVSMTLASIWLLGLNSNEKQLVVNMVKTKLRAYH